MVEAEAITQVIDCAIGMNNAIGDKAAITFAASNKPELLTRKGVDPTEIAFLTSMDNPGSF